MNITQNHFSNHCWQHFNPEAPVSCSVFSGFSNWVCLKAVYIPKNLVPLTERDHSEVYGKNTIFRHAICGFSSTSRLMQISSATLQQSVRARREVNGSRHSISLSGWLWQNSSRNWVAFIVTLYAHVTWDFSTGNLFGWKPCRLLRPPIFVPDSIAQSIHLLPYPQAICCGKFLVQGTIHWPESRRRRDSLDFIGASHLYVYIYICLDFVICLMLNWQSLINQCKYGIFRCRL